MMPRKLFKSYCMLFCFLGTLLILSCAENPAEGPEPATSIVMPTVYGNGVYYFPAIGKSFGASLAKFKADNQHLEITAIAPSENMFGRGISGYFVDFKQKRIDSY